MNKPIRTLSLFCLLLFIALLGRATYLQYYDASSLDARPENRRVIEAAYSAERGAILVGRTPIAESKASNDKYKFQRTYTQPNKFEVYRFKPDQITIDNIHYSVEVYCQRAGEVQFCLVVVLPEGLDSQTKLAERVPLMLERLRISSKRQAASSAAPTAGSGGGAAPKTAAPPVSF